MEPDDISPEYIGLPQYVSIHGLAWSPTDHAGAAQRLVPVSIHGLAWSPTCVACPLFPFDNCFNPRARVEPDGMERQDRRRAESFNPRARVEPDRVPYSRFGGYRGFNPRARVEPDYRRGTTMTRPEGFNPRARVEPDTGSIMVPPPYDSFNPRARVEPDPLFGRVARSGQVFQSTGSRGARPVDQIGNDRPGVVSIHGLAWSPTGPFRFDYDVLSVSIHGLAWSPTSISAITAAIRVFQSTGSRGARRQDHDHAQLEE